MIATGKIVSHIPGNWLIIRRCFSFDGNDNVDIIVHSKNVKLRPKHKDTVIRKGVKSNAISSAQ